MTDQRALRPAVGILHDEVERMDRLANRFRADSELSVLNRCAGRTVRVSEELQLLLGVAGRVARATGGRVDPTVGAALCRLGYDRDFAGIVGGVAGGLPTPAAIPGWSSVEMDPHRGTLRLAPGTMLDLGAVAKALTADRVAAAVATRLGCGVEVSLGGDVAVDGPAPPGGFVVGIAETWDTTRPSVRVAVTEGGLATSGVAARRWRLGHQEVHHVIDPSTGLPAHPVWRTATVAASSCVDANAGSTAAVVLGHAAPQWLTTLDLPARLVSLHGEVVAVAGWPEWEPTVTAVASQR